VIKKTELDGQPLLKRDWLRLLPIHELFGEGFVMLILLRWPLHWGAVLYLLMIPWALPGASIFARPKWIVSVTRAAEKRDGRDMDRLGKWRPPGFP
jgi:hypothetical protein